MTTKQTQERPTDTAEEMQPVRLSRTQVRGIYDRLAPIYDGWSAPFESRARARVLDIIASRQAERILEVAVGPGAAFAKILGANPDGLTVGLDLSHKMLSRAASRAARSGRSSYLLLQADALHLPLPDDSFEVVTNSYMLDLLPVVDIRNVLAEYKRVLKPGGTLVLANMTHSDALLSTAWKWLYSRSPSLVGGCRAVLAAPFLEELGFAGVRREFISQLSFPSEVLTATNP
jgi:ubiquinone/menaquinone biosynthesis C-methylase UbiE